MDVLREARGVRYHPQVVTAHRQCIFCRAVFPLNGGELPEECPECGTDLPDDSFVVAVPGPAFADEGTLDDLEVATARPAVTTEDLDRTDKLPALSVIHDSRTDELDPTRIDNAALPTVQDRSFGANVADVTLRAPTAPPIESYPTETGDSGNGRSRAPLAPSAPMSHQQDFPTYAGDVDDTGQMTAFDDATFTQPTMDLDALAAAVPEKDATPSSTPQTWACPACGAEWTAVSAEFCPACDWRRDDDA